MPKTKNGIGRKRFLVRLKRAKLNPLNTSQKMDHEEMKEVFKAKAQALKVIVEKINNKVSLRIKCSR